MFKMFCKIAASEREAPVGSVCRAVPVALAAVGRPWATSFLSAQAAAGGHGSAPYVDQTIAFSKGSERQAYILSSDLYMKIPLWIMRLLYV